MHGLDTLKRINEAAANFGLKQVLNIVPSTGQVLKEWLVIDKTSYKIHMDFDTPKEAEEYSQGRYIIVQVNRVIVDNKTYYFR